MALRIGVEDGVLLFTSDHYFLRLGQYRCKLPPWLSPGHLTVSHHAVSETQFEFGLDVVHRWFGKLLHQRALFEDQKTA
jgi:hypothetical protein